MKIKKIILRNFRGYKDNTIDIDSRLNTIIAKNDVGKSSILEALDVFLQGGVIKMDTNDLNVFSASDKKITIGIVFETEEDKKYLIDEKVSTSLQDESLLNQCGFLEIHKVWDCSGKTVIQKNGSIYFNSYYFDEFETPLIILKNAELKKELSTRNLVSSCKDQKVNSLIRQTIYENLSNKDEKTEKLIQIDKEDAKKVWENISKELPMLFLFQSDKANKDTDKDVQDPLKAITKQAISTIQEDLDHVKSKIESEIKIIIKPTVEKMKEMEPSLENSLDTTINTKPWESLFSFSFDGDDNIPLNKRGSGVRRLILLNYFRTVAEQKNKNGRDIVYAIEEPETSQHPNYQIMLFNALKDLGDQEKVQIFVTTHSPEMVKLCNSNEVIFLKKDKKDIVVDTSENKIKKIVETLGIIPYLSRFCVFVEGNRDISFLKEINNIKELKEIIDISEIKILPIIGGNITNWVDRQYVKDTNIKALYLLDGDKESNKEYAKKINDNNGGSKAIITNSLMMENYFSYTLVGNKFDITFKDKEKNLWSCKNIIKLIKEKSKCKDERDIKNKLSKELSKEITKESLEKIGVWEEVKGWFEKINEMNGECL